MANKAPLTKELTKGIIKENPTLIMLLGMCPTLAVVRSSDDEEREKQGKEEISCCCCN